MQSRDPHVSMNSWYKRDTREDTTACRSRRDDASSRRPEHVRPTTKTSLQTQVRSGDEQ
jgi:hypothetical protein